MLVTENSMAILRERILQPDEMPEEMAARVAKYVSNGDADLETKFFDLINGLWFLPNSPCLMNAGTEIGQLCACFVIPIEDTMESIFGALRDMALIQKTGGGTGFNFSRLRHAGDKVNSTNGVASGPVSFLKIFNAATEEIKQGGKRRGASLAVLNVDHPDILDFIHCKRDTDQLKNFNISVGVTDEFMAAVLGGDNFTLRNPRNGEVMTILPAKIIWDEIIQNAWETGEPGILFLDTINKFNPTPHEGRIEACNPCSEATLLPWESCVLGSINLSKMVKNGKIDYDRLAEVVFLSVIFLDNIIDLNKYPLPEIENVTKRNRKIGVGIMGLADMFFQLGIPYDSQEAIATAAKVMSFINTKAIEASQFLAQERGPFPNFPNSIYRDGKPRRNAVVTSIAPTGTLAAIANTTFSTEPEYALIYTKTILNGKQFTVINPFFEAALKKHGLYNDYLIEKIKANRGSIQGINEIPEEIRKVFRVAYDIAPNWHIDMQAALQKHVEQSISKTINLPENSTVNDIASIYFSAWKSGCKGVTVYRDGSRPQQVLSAKYVPAKRPQVLEGRTYKYTTGCGSLYITVNRDLAGSPHELFTAHSKNGGCVSALLNTLSRVTSIALRAGVDASSIVKTMKGQDCGYCREVDEISSCADAVGKALQEDMLKHGANIACKVNDKGCVECG